MGITVRDELYIGRTKIKNPQDIDGKLTSVRMKWSIENRDTRRINIVVDTRGSKYTVTYR